MIEVYDTILTICEKRRVLTVNNQHNIYLMFLSVLGLACRLTEPAHRPRPIKNIRSDGGEWEVNRSEIKIERKLGSGNFGIVFKGICYIMLRGCQ